MKTHGVWVFVCAVVVSLMITFGLVDGVFALTISGDNVGIGTDTPTEKLDVSGNIKSSGTVSANSFSGDGSQLTGISAGNITTGTISSDRLADYSVTPVKIAFLGKVAIVASSGGDYTDPAAAMGDYATWCGTPSATNPCLLKIMPGVYNVGSSPVVMQPYIDIEGSGEKVTAITGSVADVTDTPAHGVVDGADSAELRFITVINTASGTDLYPAAIVSTNVSPSLLHVTASASGVAHRNHGIVNNSSSATMNHVAASASGATINNYGIWNISAAVTMSNVTATVSGSGSVNNAIVNDACPSFLTMNNVKATASGATTLNRAIFSEDCHYEMSNVIASATGGNSSMGIDNNIISGSYSLTMSNITASASGAITSTRGVRNVNAAPVMTNLTATASGGTNSYGIYNSASSPTMNNVKARGADGTNNYGLYNTSTGATIHIDRSTFEGATNSIFNSSGYSLKIGASKLDGVVNNGVGTWTCVGSYDATYAALDATCAIP